MSSIDYIFPKLRMLQAIGLWNIILTMMITIHSAAFYATSIEKLVNMNDRTSPI